MKKYILLLDLKDDPELIQTYEEHHKQIPEAITKSILEAGIVEMNLFRFQDRLVMEILAQDQFSFEKKNQIDHNNQEVQNWELLMSKYQKNLPNAPKGVKWVLTEQIFSLSSKK
jgi:L-rhamnose mutarotase